MRSSRMTKAVILCAATLLLGGCGEAPYELTESEESLIVHMPPRLWQNLTLSRKTDLHM